MYLVYAVQKAVWQCHFLLPALTPQQVGVMKIHSALRYQHFFTPENLECVTLVCNNSSISDITFKM